MLSRKTRIFLPFFAVTMLLAAPFVGAQVTLDLTTATSPPTNCTVMTDVQGLRLAAGGASLMATGVTLTGTGCGTAGSDNYQTAVSVPVTAAAGTAFNVSWAASAQATQCTYGGSAAVNGWPVGSAACQGAACSGLHNTSVTVPTAGAYSFSVTCTNTSGFAQGALTATNGVPQPNPFALTAPATANVGTPFTVAWTVSGATACSGSASLNGSSVSFPGWTDVTTPSSPRTLTPSQVGAYVLNLDCSNAVGHAFSVPANITVQGSDNCPAGRQTAADVCFNNNLTNCAASSDVTAFANIFGRTSPTSPPVPFVGVNFISALKNMNKTGYVAAKFVVPNDIVPLQTGLFTHGETYPGPNITMAISPACGDFNPPNSSQCLVSDVSGGSIAGKYKVAGGPGNGCPLTPGQSYFINVKMTNPPVSGSDCVATTCTVSLQNNHTP